MSAPEKNNLLAIPFDSLKTKDKNNNKKNPIYFTPKWYFIISYLDQSGFQDFVKK